MFKRHFEGAEVLDGLLELAGSRFDTQGVLARFVAGHQAGEAASAVIPGLFEGEPHFPDPEIARRLYQNLLGLWDLVASGNTVELRPTERPRPRKRPKPTPPPVFSPGEPDDAFVEAAWRWVEDLPEGDPRTLERLTHAFENREDALVQWIDEAGLSDEAYATTRYLLFELFAMLETGWGPGLRAIARGELDQAPADGAGLPAPLTAYADEALAGSELQDDAAVRALVYRGLWALWNARRPA
ncbi:MAG: hypothetical protein IRZ16_03105 [Myxococcaceae bacterium]|nr:hypothetical protein [Myxococcaceae bacterium]